MFLLLLLILITEEDEVEDLRTGWNQYPTSTPPVSHLYNTYSTMPPIVREKEQGSLQEPEDSSFSDCFNRPERAYLVPPLNSSSWNFTVKGPVTCWQYCEHLKPCRAMSFYYPTSACLLFKLKTFQNYEIELTPPQRNIGKIHKSCIEAEKYSKIDLQDAVQRGLKGKGVMIQYSFCTFPHCECLSVGKVFSDGWFLDLTDCSKPDEFAVRKIRKDGTLRIYHRKNASLCVNVTLLSDLALAYLAPCQDEAGESSQDLEIK